MQHANNIIIAGAIHYYANNKRVDDIWQENKEHLKVLRDCFIS